MVYSIFNVETAKLLQAHLSQFILVKPIDFNSIDVVVAVDVGYKGSEGIGVAVAFDFKNQEELCHIAVVGGVNIPYIPGFLAFREAPLMVTAVRELSSRCAEPDVILVNGHGLAHPRRFGIASHIGVVLDKPSIGVAKKLLYGSIVVDESMRKAIVVDDVKVGYVLENRYGEKIFISVGHKLTADDAIAIVKTLWQNDSLPMPDPMHIADMLTKKLRYRI